MIKKIKRMGKKLITINSLILMEILTILCLHPQDNNKIEIHTSLY